MYKYLKYYLLLVLIFCVDKVALIPTVQLNFTNAAAVNPYLETLDNQEPPVSLHKDRTVWIFGSSRSQPFARFPVDEQTKADPFLTPAEKEKVLATSFESFTYPAANPYLFLTRLHQLLDRGLKPDLIAIELSPSALNKNRSINNVITMEGIPVKTVLRHPESFPYEMQKDILLSRLFATYRYKTNFFDLLLWRPRKQAAMFDQLGGLEAFQNQNRKFKDRVNRVFHDHEWGDLPLQAKDQNERRLQLDDFTEFHEKLYYVGWVADPSLVDAIVTMARIGKENSIPVIVFKPYVYPALNELKTKYGFDKNILPGLKSRLQAYNVHYIDFNESQTIKCSYFIDASHLSNRCITEMSARLLQSAGID